MAHCLGKYFVTVFFLWSCAYSVSSLLPPVDNKKRCVIFMKVLLKALSLNFEK